MKTKFYTYLLVMVLGMISGVNYTYAFIWHHPCLELFSKTYILKTKQVDAFKVEYFNNDLVKELINFDVVKNGDKVEVFWTIASEPHHNYFTLERSRNGIDFEKVSVIDATSSVNNMIQYLETDNQPLNGISYYRLKLTDLHNENSYSNSIKVNYTFGKKRNMRVSHLVSVEALKLFFKTEEHTEVLMVLKDTHGKEWYSKVIVAIENSEIIGDDPEKKLVAGTYIIIATSNNLLYNQKLIVRK